MYNGPWFELPCGEGQRGIRDKTKIHQGHVRLKVSWVIIFIFSGVVSGRVKGDKSD